MQVSDCIVDMHITIYMYINMGRAIYPFSLSQAKFLSHVYFSILCLDELLLLLLLLLLPLLRRMQVGAYIWHFRMRFCFFGSGDDVGPTWGGGLAYSYALPFLSDRHSLQNKT